MRSRFSEGSAAAAGKAPFGTIAREGRRRLADQRQEDLRLAPGAADYYGVLCTEDKPERSMRDTLYIAGADGAPGVAIIGDWDPLGMRGTVSRTLVMKDVFVPDDDAAHAARRLLQGGAALAAHVPDARADLHGHRAARPTISRCSICAARCRASRRSSGACTRPSRSRSREMFIKLRADARPVRAHASPRPSRTRRRTSGCAATRRSTRSWRTPTTSRGWRSAPAAASRC